MENIEDEKSAEGGSAMNSEGEKHRQKKIDEAWKDAVEKEKSKEAGADSKIQEEYPQQITFDLFLSSLMIEGLIALGEIENPVTKKKETRLGQARYVIDVIAMLEEKTKNNTTTEEKDAISHILYELRMRYIAKKG